MDLKLGLRLLNVPKLEQGFIVLLLTLCHFGSEIWHLLNLRNRISHPIWGKVLYSSFLCTISQPVFYGFNDLFIFTHVHFL